MEDDKAILIGRSGRGSRYAMALNLAAYIHTAELTAEEIEAIKLEALEKDIPINEALSDTAEQARLAADAMQQIMPLEYKALSALYKPTEPLPIRTKSTKGGAYNCRKPKYKTKKRR